MAGLQKIEPGKVPENIQGTAPLRSVEAEPATRVSVPKQPLSTVSADQLRSQQSQLGINFANLSNHEKAFILMLAIDMDTYDILKKLCDLKTDDSLSVLTEKVSSFYLDEAKRNGLDPKILSALTSAHSAIEDVGRYQLFIDGLSVSLVFLDRILPKEIYESLSADVRKSLIDAGYIDENRQILPKFNGNLSDFAKDPLIRPLQERVKIYLFGMLSAYSFFSLAQSVEYRICSRAFSEALKDNIDKNEFGEFKKILKEFNIDDPLKVPIKTLKSMTLLQREIFSNTTGFLLYLAKTYMSYDEIATFNKYRTALIQERAAMLDNFMPEGLRQIHARVTMSQMIENSDDLRTEPISLEGLSARAQELLREYDAALKEYGIAVKNNPSGQGSATRLSAALSAIVLEYESEYIGAFIDTPSDEEKASFSKLLNVAKELNIADQTTVYFWRLSEPALTGRDRTIIEDLRKLRSDVSSFSKLAFIQKSVIGDKFDHLPPAVKALFQDSGDHYVLCKDWMQMLAAQPLSAQDSQVLADILKANSAAPLDIAQTPESCINSYPQPVRAILNEYLEAVRSEARTANDGVSRVGKGRSRAEALYFVLNSLGFTEKELLAFDAMAGYETLDDATKSALKGTSEEQIDICLKELKAIVQEGRGTKEKARLNILINKYNSLTSIIYGLIGSQIKASTYIMSNLSDMKAGALIVSAYDFALSTPEGTDDSIAERGITRFFANGGDSFGVMGWEIARTHMSACLKLGKKVDYCFIKDVLASSQMFSKLFSNGKEIGLPEFRALFFECLTWMEMGSVDSDNFNNAKEKLLVWVVKFINNNLTLRIESEPKFIGSMEMAENIGVLSSIYELLLNFGVMNQESLASFSSSHSIVEPKKVSSTAEFSGGGAFHTIGLDNIPQDVLDEISKLPGARELLEKNKDCLDIYWVPSSISNDYFAGLSTADKSTILVVYQDLRDRSINDSRHLAEVLFHEFSHKLFGLKWSEFCAANQDVKGAAVPMLLTERYAYLNTLNFWESQPDPDIKMINQSIELIRMLNLMLGLKEDAGLGKDERSLLPPSFEGIDLSDAPYSIQIANLSVNGLSSDYLKKLDGLLDTMGYTGAEKRKLFTECMYVFAGRPYDLPSAGMSKGTLFLDFVSKMLKTIVKEDVNNDNLIPELNTTRGYLSIFSETYIKSCGFDKLPIFNLTQKDGKVFYVLKENASEIIASMINGGNCTLEDQFKLKYMLGMSLESTSFASIGIDLLRIMIDNSTSRSNTAK